MRIAQPIKYLFAFIMVSGSCSEPEVILPKEEEPTNCRVVLLGDRDGFGAGLLPGQAFHIPAGTALPIDFRTVTDLLFTDIYPADMCCGTEPARQFEFVINFDASTATLKKSTLRFLTIGIQDGDSQVYNSSTDIRVFVDDVEIAGALDAVDQFDFLDGQWVGFVGHVEIEIPANMLYLVADGHVVVRWEIHQLIGGANYDAFAIDYCELELCENSEAEK